MQPAATGPTLLGIDVVFVATNFFQYPVTVRCADKGPALGVTVPSAASQALAGRIAVLCTATNQRGMTGAAA